MTAITSAVSSVFVCVFLMCMSVSFFVVCVCVYVFVCVFFCIRVCFLCVYFLCVRVYVFVFVFVCVCMYVLLLESFSWIFLDLVSETLGQFDPWNFRRRLVRYYFGNSWHCSSLDSSQTFPLFDCLHCFRDTRRLVFQGQDLFVSQQQGCSTHFGGLLVSFRWPGCPCTWFQATFWIFTPLLSLSADQSRAMCVHNQETMIQS